MNSTLDRLLVRIRDIEWTRTKAAVPLAEPSPFPIMTVGSLDEAHRHLEKTDWDSAVVALMKLIGGCLVERGGHESRRQWSSHVARVNAELLPIVNEKIATSAIDPARNWPLISAIANVLRLACVQREYGFGPMVPLLEWMAGLVLRGYFPCGWKGPKDHPATFLKSGTLVLFDVASERSGEPAPVHVPGLPDGWDRSLNTSGASETDSFLMVRDSAGSLTFNEETLQLLAVLRASDWPCPKESPPLAFPTPYPVLIVNSLKEAKAFAKRRDWEWAKIDFTNLSSRGIRAMGDQALLRQWSSIVGKFNAFLPALVQERIAASPMGSEAHPTLLQDILQPVRLSCMHSAYGVGPVLPLIDWIAGLILRGYIPCGWKGEFDERNLDTFVKTGTLVLYDAAQRRSGTPAPVAWPGLHEGWEKSLDITPRDAPERKTRIGQTLNTKRDGLYASLFGPVERVYSAALSVFEPKIDIHVYPPLPQSRSCYTLITSGMSDKPMYLPKDIAKQHRRFARAEIIAYAHTPDPVFIELLRRVANYPFEQNTWIAPWHTIPNGTPPEPLFPGSELDTVGIAECVVEPDRTISTELKVSRAPVTLLWLLPITSPEREYALANGFDKLLDVFVEKDLQIELDPKRQSLIRSE